MAKLSIVASSKARRPAKFWRVSRYAVKTDRSRERRRNRGDLDRRKQGIQADPEKKSPRGVASMRKP